ncbi:MAG: hypothetical protein ACJ0DG_09755 [bacterium]
MGEIPNYVLVENDFVFCINVMWMIVDNNSQLLEDTERKEYDDIKYLLGVRCKYIKHLSLLRIRIYVL